MKTLFPASLRGSSRGSTTRSIQTLLEDGHEPHTNAALRDAATPAETPIARLCGHLERALYKQFYAASPDTAGLTADERRHWRAFGRIYTHARRKAFATALKG